MKQRWAAAMKHHPNRSMATSMTIEESDHSHLRRSGGLREPTDLLDTTSEIQPGSSSFWTPVIWCILITETAERFAYYGFRAVLVLYFLNSLGYKETTAIALYGYHSALCNFTPLVGAYLADSYLGRYCTILVFASIYVVGLAVLASAAASSLSPTNDRIQWKQYVSFIGLFLVGLGTGGIKPCVSAFGADQLSGLSPADDHRDSDDSMALSQTVEQQEHHGTKTNGYGEVHLEPDAVHTEERLQSSTEHNVRAFFNWFYFSINVGAVASIAVVPLVRSRFGFGWAFGIPCLCMLGALGTFVSKRRAYVYQPINSTGGSGNVVATLRVTGWLMRQQIVSYCCQSRGANSILLETNDAVDTTGVVDTRLADFTARGLGDNGTHNWDERQVHGAVVSSRPNQQLEDAEQLLRMLPILAMFPIYACLYDQQGSVWTLQATRMYLPWGIQAEQLNMINPVQIMLFIPLFDRVVYPFLESRSWDLSPLKRMAWGMLLTAVAFSVSGLVESAIQQTEEQGSTSTKVHVGWQLPQITILAVGEIFLSVTGLEFTYATSPARLKAFATALYLSTSAVGDGLAGVLYSTVFATMNRATVMHACAGLMMGNLLMFVFVSKAYERQEAFRGQEKRATFSTEAGVVELHDRQAVMT
jgi:dipeptide/tripeptide permease